MDTLSAFAAIVGRPNVGKSSLLNAMVGRKVAIVSDKPQTTRTRIMGVVTRDKTQLVFLDTPGNHKPRTRLGDFMVRSIGEAVSGVDVGILVTEPRVNIREEEEALLLKVAEEYKAHLTAPCTGCRYCTDGCPQQLDIPKLMGVYNRFAYLGELRRDAYDGIPADKQADACIGCGACATHCPQSLDIPGLLGKLAAAKK